MAVIEIKGAGFGYDTQNIFEDICLDITKGEVLCIVGPNGCGKTTLLDCILGIKKVRYGCILLNGRDIDTIRTCDIARQIAYVPQTHEKTFPYTVMEIVMMGRAAYTGIFSSPTDQDRKIAEECLEEVGIGRLKDRPYTNLSGGEGQLVMLARALAQRTPVIVMDEPTAHLDFKHELTVMETIARLVSGTELAVIMATHFPNHAFYFENAGLETRVALMNNKNFISIGRPSGVLNEQNLNHLYSIDARVVSFDLGDGAELKQIIPVSTRNNCFR